MAERGNGDPIPLAGTPIPKPPVVAGWLNPPDMLDSPLKPFVMLAPAPM